MKRVVHQKARSTWSLSPTGEGLTVTVTAHGSDLTVMAPGYGVIVNIAGRGSDDGFHGTFIAPEDPAVADKLCAALGG